MNRKKELFLQAVEKGSVEMFNNNFNKEYLEEVFYSSKRPIHIACEKGHYDIVKLLIERKCNINETGEYLKRPIHIACEKGFPKIVELLIHKKCKINEKDTKEQCPIHLACSGCHVDIVKILIENKSKINVCDERNESPIHLTCEKGNVEILKILINNNCDIDILNNKKQSALDIAKQKGYKEIIRLIEDYSFQIKLEKDLKTLRNEMITNMNLECGSGCDHKFCSTTLQRNDFSRVETKKILDSGNIYICKSSTTDMEFAVKVLAINLDDIKLIERAINKWLKGVFHERIVKYYGIMENGKHLQIFMESIHGSSLNDEILKEKLLSWVTTMKYTKQLLQALEYLHKNRIVHNNLQPSKVLLDSEKNVKLVDFIEYKSLLPKFDKFFRGNSNFIAPEIRNGNCYKMSANIWSLGAIIVNMLTGNPPTLEMILSEVMNNIKKKTKFPPEIREIEIMNDFVSCLLNPEPDQRLTASQLLNHKIFTII